MTPEELNQNLEEIQTQSHTKLHGSVRHDLSGGKIKYIKGFSPSAVAYRSYLYLQGLLEVHFGSNYFTTRSNSHSYLLLQTISGSGVLMYHGSSYELLPNDVFIIDGMQLHDYRTNSIEGWHYKLAHFNGFSMRDIFDQILLNKNIFFHFENNSDFTSAFKELFDINQISSPKNEILSNKLLHKLMSEILITLPQYNANYLPVRINQIREYIEKNCCKHISLDIVADNFNMNKFSLSREIKKYTGKTVLELIVNERLLKAKNLLRYTDCSIEDITEYIGYESVSHFSRIFRKQEQITPSLYRRKWKGL